MRCSSTTERPALIVFRLPLLQANLSQLQQEKGNIDQRLVNARQLLKVQAAAGVTYQKVFKMPKVALKCFLVVQLESSTLHAREGILIP